MGTKQDSELNNKLCAEATQALFNLRFEGQQIPNHVWQAVTKALDALNTWGKPAEAEVLVERQADGNVVVKGMPVEWCTVRRTSPTVDEATICLDPAIAATLMDALAKVVQS